jgi:hypothetical protein
LQVAFGQQPGQVSAVVAPLGDARAELLVATMLGEQMWGQTSGVFGNTEIVDLR